MFMIKHYRKKFCKSPPCSEAGSPAAACCWGRMLFLNYTFTQKTDGHNRVIPNIRPIFWPDIEGAGYRESRIVNQRFECFDNRSAGYQGTSGP